MELSKNIFFNTDKLVENSKVKISYTGSLFQDASQEVFIHYGFGHNWENVNDVKMEKTVFCCRKMGRSLFLRFWQQILNINGNEEKHCEQYRRK